MSKARDLANAGTALTTVSATELGYLDGVTSAVQTQLNAKQAVVSGVNDTEIGYLDGVTSAIQTQLNAKEATLPSQTGNSGKYLTTDGTNKSWGTVSTGSNFTLINAGGTSLTGNPVTISGLAGYDKIKILVKNISSGNDSSTIFLRINADSGSNYNMFGRASKAANDPYGTVGRWNGQTETYARVLMLGASASANGDAAISIDGANSTGVKMIQVDSGVNGVNGEGGEDYNLARAYNLQGTWNSSSTVTSISLGSSSGSFDAGTIYVYASA